MNIKKLISPFLFCLISVFSAYAQAPVEISGILKKRLSPVKLFKVAEGKVVEIANTNPTGNGQFGFLFYPEYEGLYLVGTGNTGSPSDNYKFYFKGGDKLDLTLLDSSYVLNGKLNSKENMLLTQWHDLVFPLEHRAINFMKVQSTFVDYFPLQEEIVAQTKNFLTGKTTGNAQFDKKMRDIMTWDLASYAANFLNTPRTAHPAVEEFSPFYATLHAQDFAKNTRDLYTMPYGLRTLNGLINVNFRQQNLPFLRGVDGVKTTLNFVPNDTLKGEFVLDAAANYKTHTEFKALMDAFGQYVVTTKQKKRKLDIETPLLTLKTGEEAYPFSYPDKDGKTVSLASLKGKVVLVDVWATWCGPCRQEIPFLKKLEEEMKGKAVAFVSLSTDAVADKEKWLKMIKDDNLGGIQLFAGGPGNEFSQYYKVNTIPRFLVFDKQGKIVTVDSPRPSDPELKTLLERELAK